ncbi:hypothetical protein ACU8L5_12835 [Rhizobium leguminosarum]|uniref:Uncharacterized protein n=1 Tax=Rhizobium indigoferae TaxID=158891 RepID=A0ABZ0ZD46_9HYPH|nr:hypothetical protein [Rhizobium indigoferae]NNU53029.1 hypothetical protein [Rhizobium indigoferae]WQN37448.1 hypothetical protein U5G49_002575 [Rhizobium indigoferae]GLR60345.1 hypothetical protein GCM10007919_50730 [Rhizobium indigoferae]
MTTLLDPEIALDGGNFNAAVVRVGCRPGLHLGGHFEHWRCETEAFALNPTKLGQAL